MPIYEYQCQNPDCPGPRPKDNHPLYGECKLLPQELLVPMADEGKHQACKYCGMYAIPVQWHGKSHLRFHFNYMSPN